MVGAEAFAWSSVRTAVRSIADAHVGKYGLSLMLVLVCTVCL